jgi:dUTP pyrophosphatase
MSDKWSDICETVDDISSEEEVPQPTMNIGSLLGDILGKGEEEKLESNPPLARATRGSAGYDLISTVNVTIPPSTSVMIDTGVRISIPSDCYAQIYTRSSVALNGKTKTSSGITCTEHSVFTLAGVIDSDFEDSIRVILHNSSLTMPYKVSQGDRIAQLIIHRIHTFTNELPPLKDDTFEHKGFGSTN